MISIVLTVSVDSSTHVATENGTFTLQTILLIADTSDTSAILPVLFLSSVKFVSVVSILGVYVK
jgi:hypothetical protein